MEKYDDGFVGPRTAETIDQMLCMKGMTNSEKVDFLMSRNREMRAENYHLQAENAKLREHVAELEELTDGKLYIPQEWYQLATTENAKLRELVRDMARAWWACDNERCPHGSSCDAAVSEGKLTDCEMERRMAELGCEVGE
jgi:regulator of replication initiation timing